MAYYEYGYYYWVVYDKTKETYTICRSMIELLVFLKNNYCFSQEKLDDILFSRLESFDFEKVEIYRNSMS